MSNLNAHIKDYLSYYVALDEPGFAVLLRGEWGSGKSWFIDDFTTRNDDIKFLKISLFGLNTFAEIDELFFQQLHPILSSKKMRFAGNLLKGMLKATIKLDLDGDKKDEGSINASIPEIDFPSYLKDTKSRVIIFDDLERCNIPNESLLGYINQMVEVQGQKVVILANEKELLNKIGEDAVHYSSTKEKIIGRSFTVVSDFDSAVYAFICEIKDHNVRDLLSTDDYAILRKQFLTSDYNNLRHLRQGILDFERLYAFLPQSAIEKNNILDHILELFFAITFELKKGFINEEDLPALFGMDILALADKHEKTNVQKVRSKYQIFHRNSHPISPFSWREYFGNGWVDKEEVKKTIENSEYFEENRPTWIRLWDWNSLEDNEFKNLSAKLTTELKKCLFTNQHEVLHVAGILMTLSKEKLIKTSAKTILKFSIKSLQALATKKELHLNATFRDHHFGRSLQGTDIPEFIDLKARYVRIIESSRQLSYVSTGQTLLSVFNSSIEDFAESVTLTNSRNNIYFNVPILKHINSQSFVSAIENLSNKDKGTLIWALERRYSVAEFHSALKEELQWLAEIKLKLELRKKRMGKISSFNTTQIIEELQKAIAVLEKA